MSYHTAKRSFDAFIEANGTSPASEKPHAAALNILDTLHQIRTLPIETPQVILHEIGQQDPKIAAQI